MSSGETLRVRIDKWLWAARFFKTRSLAAAAIAGNKIKCNGDQVKPARELNVGDEVDITVGDSRFIVIVQAVADQRRPAPEARLLYAETNESLASRIRQQELQRLAPMPGSTLKGRPSKRAGRLMREING